MTPEDLARAARNATNAFLDTECSCGHAVRRHHRPMSTRGILRCVDCAAEGSLCLLRRSDVSEPIRAALRLAGDDGGP